LPTLQVSWLTHSSRVSSPLNYMHVLTTLPTLYRKLTR
jgi:hypothetical protein